MFKSLFITSLITLVGCATVVKETSSISTSVKDEIGSTLVGQRVPFTVVVCVVNKMDKMYSSKIAVEQIIKLLQNEPSEELQRALRICARNWELHRDEGDHIRDILKEIEEKNAIEY